MAVSSSTLLRLRTLAGLDIDVIATILFRGWGILAGAITLVLLPHWLTPTQQGYYYTFASLLALQVFFELGLSQVIIQLVGYEAAHLEFNDGQIISGSPDRIARLGSIVLLVRRWFALAAVLFLVLGGVLGAIFFGHHTQILTMREWVPVWSAMVVLTAINLYFSPQLAVVEGTGQVGQVARLRLFQSIVGYFGLWLLLMADFGLWAIVAVPFASASVTAIWLCLRQSWLKTKCTDSTLISWWKDVFPLQWRIALSWACGYFIFSLFTPIVFANQGAIEAGRIGIAMSVFAAVTSFGLSWVNAKTPALAMHVARGESAELDILFIGVAIRSTAITAFLGFTIVGLVTLGIYLNFSLFHRVAAPQTLFWIAIASTVNTAIYAAAVYMRAHREEPMLPVSIASAVATIAVVFFLRDNVTQMMLGYAAVSTLLGLPWTFSLLKAYRTRHSATI